MKLVWVDNLTYCNTNTAIITLQHLLCNKHFEAHNMKHTLQYACRSTYFATCILQLSHFNMKITKQTLSNTLFNTYFQSHILQNTHLAIPLPPPPIFFTPPPRPKKYSFLSPTSHFFWLPPEKNGYHMTLNGLSIIPEKIALWLSQHNWAQTINSISCLSPKLKFTPWKNVYGIVNADMCRKDDIFRQRWLNHYNTGVGMGGRIIALIIHHSF